jgi:putative ABC transport system substrate-binding protein
MRRRRFLAALAVAGCAPRFGRAQQGRQYRIGWVATSANTFREPYGDAFVRRLAELGLVEGKNLAIDRRHADNRIENFAKVAAAMAGTRYDVLFAGGPEATLAAAAQASREAPIVVVAIDFDPVATGDVASLARPGGRVTGVSMQQSTLPAKRLELLKELLPRASKIAVLTNEQTQGQLTVLRGTARRLGLRLHVVDLRRPPFDLPAAFAGMAQEKCDGVFVTGSALFAALRSEIIRLAFDSRLPASFQQAQWVELGGLTSYGFNFTAAWRRGAEMVAAVLNGAKTAEMPMEVPAAFELALNLKTARGLGLTVPQTLLLRADRIFE